MLKRLLGIVCAVVAALGLCTPQAWAQAPAPVLILDSVQDEMNLCLCRNALARMLCKKTGDLNFVAKADPTGYYFNVFWGSKEVRFYCGVDPNSIRIQARTGQQFTRTIPFAFDNTSRCSTLSYSVPECPTYRKVSCCMPKTKEEKEQESFWNRPVLDLLKQDMERAQNATTPAPVPAK